MSNTDGTSKELDGLRLKIADNLIDEEIKLYEIYKDNSDICVGIKLMADQVRELYADSKALNEMFGVKDGS